MYQKFSRALKNLHLGQKGMTGLETAIILIAFVTVASVLAYSVLSAGIFSAERGKATVYSGLEQASATMEIKGSVVGDATSSGNVTLDYVYFLVGLTIPEESVDMSALAIHVYTGNASAIMTNEDWTGSAPGNDKWQFQKVTDSTERGATIAMDGDEVFEIVVDTANFENITAHEWFVIEVIPPTGATITIKRTLPGNLKTKMNLK